MKSLLERNEEAANDPAPVPVLANPLVFPYKLEAIQAAEKRRFLTIPKAPFN